MSTAVSSSTTQAETTTTQPMDGGTYYFVAGTNGVFEVVGDTATSVLNRSDVTWAAGDGSGGLVFTTSPGVVLQLVAGCAAPEVIATESSVRFVTRASGIPTLAVTSLTGKRCAADAQDSTLIDLTTGVGRVHIPCVPLESRGLHPESVGGDLWITVEGGGWPAEAPVWSKLVFYPVDLPGWVSTITAWDEAALGRLAGLEIPTEANPWPEPCVWCTLEARLAPDGATLAVGERVPEPADLGADTWEQFGALDIAEQWARWEQAMVTGAVPARIRVFDMADGTEMASFAIPSTGRLLDFDGRYALWVYGGQGHHSQFPYNTHLIDTITGDEVPINWGIAAPGEEAQTITLGLR